MIQLLARQLVERHTFSDDIFNGDIKPLAIGSVSAALQEAPEVFQTDSARSHHRCICKKVRDNLRRCLCVSKQACRKFTSRAT